MSKKKDKSKKEIDIVEVLEIEEVPTEEIVENKKEEKVKEVKVEPVKIYTSTEKTFGKCRVTEDKITIYETNNGKVKEKTLEKGRTFYYDRIHTKGDKQYVSWNAVAGRSYTLLKDLKTGKMPVSKIG
jgi:hypothetical protein